MAPKKTPKAPARPKSVPAGAKWDHDDQEWGLGKKDGAHHVGEWKWWRRDGTSCCHSRFDAKGKLHGEFNRYHEDGTVSRSGTYRHGKEVGVESWTRSRKKTSEQFPSEAKSVWRVEVDHDRDEDDEQHRRYFLRDGRRATARGVALDEAHHNELFAKEKPETFLSRGGLERYLRATTKLSAKPGADVRAGLRDFAEVWGVKPPADFARLVDLLSRAQKLEFHELRRDFTLLQKPKKKSENLFETLILRDQKNYLGSWTPEAFSGCVCTGQLGNGDMYMLGVYDTHAGLPQEHVWFWDHDDHALTSVFASDLSTLAYAAALTGAYEDVELVDKKTFAAGWKKADPRISPSWHWRSTRERAGARGKPYAPPHEQTRAWYYRALWIIYLLRNDGVCDVGDIPDKWVENLQKLQYDQMLPKVPKIVPTALYLMWRFFFFRDARLPEVLRAAQKSKSLLVRDSARLVAELDGGRKKLGTIENVHTLREKFLALDLDPARAEKRAKEKKAAGKAKAKAAAVSRDVVAEAVTAGRDLEELAWETLEDEAAHAAILARWKDDPAFAPTAAALAWVDAKGWQRDNLILEEELFEMGFALRAAGDRRVIPLLAGRQVRGDTYVASSLLARIADPRAAAAVRPLLDREGKYRHVPTAALRVLRAARDHECVDRVVALLRENKLHGDYTTKIRNEDLVREAIAFLGELGEPTAREPLEQIVQHPDRAYDDVRGPAAEALARIGDPTSLPAVLAAARKSERDDPPFGVLWALGELGKRADAEGRAAAIAALEPFARGERGRAGPRAVALGAMQKLAADGVALADAVHAALSPSGFPYGSDRIREQRRWILRVIGESNVDLAPAFAFSRSGDHVLRTAALEALALRGAEAPPLRYAWKLGLEQRSLAELHEMLADSDTVFRYNVALRLGELRDPSSAEPLAAHVREVVRNLPPIGSGEDTPYELHWPLRALKAFPGPIATEVFRELLASDHPKLRDPVLRDPLPPHHESLIPAMVALLDEDNWMASTAAQWLKKYEKHPAYKEAIAARE